MLNDLGPGSVAHRRCYRLGSLEITYRRSLVDMAALRFSPSVAGSMHSLPAAGLPWFMAMFGRDSILTSLQALPFNADLAATTLRVLADWQGTRVDDFRDEDPGRILHEMRYGETVHSRNGRTRPTTATPTPHRCSVVLLDEYERWSGNAHLVRELEFEARAALNWIDEYANLQGNATSRTSAATSRPAWRTSAGRTPGLDRVPRRPDPRLPASHLRTAGVRIRREDPGARLAASSGTIRRSPTGWRRTRPS